MCFSNGGLGAASLWRDRPGFGRFDIFFYCAACDILTFPRQRKMHKPALILAGCLDSLIQIGKRDEIDATEIPNGHQSISLDLP
jgi:hypothetical protein